MKLGGVGGVDVLSFRYRSDIGRSFLAMRPTWEEEALAEVEPEPSYKGWIH